MESFEELTKMREEFVASAKKNKFAGPLREILSTLQYTESAHFIYEILQNADDVAAKTVKFVLSKERLDIFHDSEKNFTHDDVEGITGIGNSTKKKDLTKIGKIGIGFKSVFTVTSTPRIFSGVYNIKIEEMIIPRKIPPDGTEKKSGTLIRLPFNHSKLKPEEAFEIVSKELRNLDLKMLLFLKNTEKIELELPDSKRTYSKSSNHVQTKTNLYVKKVFLKHSEQTTEYLVISKQLKESEELFVEVAFKLDKDETGKEIISKEKNSNFFVFFPTRENTFLDFIIQGPYKTTTNRANISFEDQKNKEILNQTGDLIAESLFVIKDLKYLDADFLEILPIQETPCHAVLYEKVKEQLLSGEFLPTLSGAYSKPADALLADGRWLADFLKGSDLQNLWSKKYWLDTKITRDMKGDLIRYLTKALGVKEANPEDFARRISKEFLETKPDEWLVSFYARFSDQKRLWDILKYKPIMRLDDDEQVTPVKEGDIQVYLPKETGSSYPMVKKCFTANEKSLEFLKGLGLKEPDLIAEVREYILPKFSNHQIDKIPEDYFNDLEKIRDAYQKIASNQQAEFREKLKKTPFVLSIQNVTEEKTLRKPDEVYLKTADLTEFFRNLEDIYFLSEKICQDKTQKFLNDMGVEDKPRRIKIENHQRTDYGYEGLENFMKDEITLERSALLWKLLLKNITKSASPYSFFEGVRKHSNYASIFAADFLEKLRQSRWLFDKNKNLKKPSDITFSEINDRYEKTPRVYFLENRLQFKPEVTEQLSDDQKKALSIGERAMQEGVTKDEFETFLATRKAKSQDNEKKWSPECEPGTTDSEIETVEPDKIASTQSIKTKSPNQESQATLPRPEKNIEEPSADKKEIGDWAQQQVYHHLKKEFEKKGKIIETHSGFKVTSDNDAFEVEDLNKNGTGIGCDFSIKKNGEDVKYIEVKGKTRENPEWVDVSRNQWELARNLFDRGEGEKYFFYVVSNVGKSGSKIRKIRNPIKLWKEGRLPAHPVRLQIP